MPGIVDLVAAISIDVNAKLVSSGLEPLQDGAIVIGAQHLEENISPPRIILLPKGSRFGPPARPSPSPVGAAARQLAGGVGVLRVAVTIQGGNYTSPTVAFSAPDGAIGTAPTATAVVRNGSIVAIALTSPGSGYEASAPTVTMTDPTGAGAAATAILAQTSEKLRQMRQRSVVTDSAIFEAHCWGIAEPPDPHRDFDLAQVVYQQLIQSTYNVTGGCCTFISGVWADSMPGATRLDALGRLYILTFSIDTPVLDTTLLFVPTGTTANPAVSFVDAATGTPESP